MKKIINYFQSHWKCLVIPIFLGISLSIIVKKLSLDLLNKVYSFISQPDIFYLLLCAYILILFIIYRPLRFFWKRYKNNFFLQIIPYTYVESIIIFFISFITSIIVVNLQTIRKISLSDKIGILLVVLCIFSLLWLCVVIFKKYKDDNLSFQSIESTATDYFPDEPINFEKDDLLDRAPFVQDLYNQIVKYPFSESFVFGLHGTWGEGKTSIINLLKLKLCKNQDVIICDYDPWYFSTQDGFIKGFYESLYSSLNKKYFLPYLKKDFTKYQKMLSVGLKLSGIQFDVTSMDQSIEELKQKIEDWISSTGKRIIILIDDMDRLNNKDEILNIFKIVKLSARLKNTIFILSFDINLISSYLTDDTKIDSSFMDKIIQNQVHLPAIQQTMIDKFLLFSFPDSNHVSAIDKLFKTLQIDKARVEEFDKDFVSLYRTHIYRLFPTLRCAKRYMNALFTTLPTIKNEVNLQDFLIIELIRVFYPNIYKDIWEHPWFYVASSWTSMYLITPFTFDDAGKKYKKINDHITEIVKNEFYHDILIELLETIFFEVKNALKGHHTSYGKDDYRINKRISHPDVFPKYFMLRVQSEELQDEIVESLISDWNTMAPSNLGKRISEDFAKIIEKNKLIHFIDKLTLFVPNLNIESARSLVKYIYEKSNTFSFKGRENFWNDEFDRADYLIVHIINQKIPKSEIENTLVEIIKEAPSIRFAVQTELSCDKKQNGNFFNIYENIDLNSLKGILSDRLANHFIKERRDIFDEEKDYSTYAFILYQWGTSSKKDKQKVNDYVFSLVEKKPEYLGKIIFSFASFWGSPLGSRIRYDEIIELYDATRLYDNIKKYYDNCYSNQDEKEAVDLFKRVYEEKNNSPLKII